MSEKRAAGSPRVKIFLERSVMNAVIHALNCFLQGDTKNTYTQFAEKLKQTIAGFAGVRKGQGGEEDTVSLFLFEDEAAVLIKTLSVYILARDGPQQDLLADIQTKKS